MLHFRSLRSLSRVGRNPSVSVPATASSRGVFTSPVLRTQTGYGDPSGERIDNQTPLPKGKNQGPKARSGHATSSTEPAKGETRGLSRDTAGKGGKGGVGNAGGKPGAGGDRSSEKEIRETKKVGEDPKKEEIGGAGPIGG
ncbi:hypothetical protein EHS25_007664 [Saitozyma podzolica]|uniref:Uncharacterized protein n=1 Tax=Saitozyma podzolica TaxID=1890683 RepID=A0A427YQH1_9TREE|nr:hypothetical protein EHS25_007664 [Saitozyma podzolica]